MNRRTLAALCMVALVAALGARTELRAEVITRCIVSPPDQSLDRPDDQYVDSNLDGIDGMRCGPIFVAPSGSDANPGTIESPMRTIGAAIRAARSHTPIRDVYVAEGTYTGPVVLAEGVNLYGGYDPDSSWTRSLSSRATVYLGSGSADVTFSRLGSRSLRWWII